MCTVWLTSFSYRRGAPQEHDQDGVGSVFDCRHLPPPQCSAPETLRSEEACSRYLSLPTIDVFYQAVRDIIFQRIDAYKKSDGAEIWFHFGCMAGEVRSVLFAELIKADIEERYNDEIDVYTYHREQEGR